MLITFAVFAILSVISLLIFLVESKNHQSILHGGAILHKGCMPGNSLQPVVITTIKNGKLHESYYYLPDETNHYPERFDHRIEDSLLEGMLMRTKVFVN